MSRDGRACKEIYLVQVRREQKSYMDPKFDSIGLRAHDLQIPDSILNVTESPALTTWPSVTIYIVLFKVFSRWFFANKNLITALRTLECGDVT